MDNNASYTSAQPERNVCTQAAADTEMSTNEQTSTPDTRRRKDAVSHSLNTKQRDRILKRRLARQKFEAEVGISRRYFRPTHPRQPISVGCMRRPRDPDGRFWTPEQIVAEMIEGLAIKTEEVKPAGTNPFDLVTREKPKL